MSGCVRKEYSLNSFNKYTVQQQNLKEDQNRKTNLPLIGRTLLGLALALKKIQNKTYTLACEITLENPPPDIR
jgi:hypothetical protein